MSLPLATDAALGPHAPMPPALTVDIHNHVVPATFIEDAERTPHSVAARVERLGDKRFLVHDNGLRYSVEEEFFSVPAKLRAMDEAGIDVAFLSPAPTLFYYWALPATAENVARRVNDGIAQMVAGCPRRLRGLGTLPLQDPQAAVRELERAVLELGLAGVEVGTSVEGEQLADPRFRPVLERAADLGALVFAHPLWLDPRCGFGAYYLTNLIGNPLDTTIMAAHLMFSGTLDALPQLKICLAHGGGFVPYQVGRFRHGHAVRPETRASSESSPVDLLKRFYFDVLLHDPKAVRHLIDQVGVERLLIGTDAPFDMGMRRPLDALAAVPGLTRREWDCICCGNALQLMRNLPSGVQIPPAVDERMLGMGITTQGAAHAG